jgi:hypothetical protein
MIAQGDRNIKNCHKRIAHFLLLFIENSIFETDTRRNIISEIKVEQSGLCANGKRARTTKETIF